MREPFADFVEKELRPKTVLIACGLPASGKTVGTTIIAGLKGYKILSTDKIRIEVLKDEDIFDEKVASDMDKRMLVYDKIFSLADELAKKGQGVILDATFVTQSLRRRAAHIAAKHGMTLVIQETQCPQEVCLRRISERTKENYSSNALTGQAFINNLKKFQVVDIDDLKRLNPGLDIIHLIVDTTSDS
ncbi:MAG: ATP-binding protein, partial [Thermodesulfobacteriota bacterium]|nr:ATP-binding protein [Thermodesulfobacteriota bacterium]